MNKIIFIFFIFLLFISVGCGSKETSDTTTNSAANTSKNIAAVEKEPEIDVNAPFTPSANPKDDLLNSTKRLQAHESWSATQENNLFPEMKIELEYVKPDRYHIKSPATEIIIVGGDGYGKEKDKWEKLPPEIAGQIDQMKKSFNAQSMSAIGEVKKEGAERIGGKDATIYTYSIPGQNVAPNVTKVWIANDSGLPLKTILETQGSDATQRQTITYNYSKPVKIEAPKIQ